MFSVHHNFQYCNEVLYDVDSLVVDLSGSVFYSIYFPFFAIVGHCVEKYTLRSIALFSTGLTAISAIVKIFVASPDRYYLVMISQTICAVSQSFIVNLPSKVACTWFGAEEVSTACGIGITGSQIGVALGMTIPTLVIRDSHDKNIITEDLVTFFDCNAAVCVGTFLLVVIYGSEADSSFKVYRYRWVVVTLFSLSFGVTYFQCFQFTIISNIVMRYYGVDSLAADMSGLVYFLVYIPSFAIVGHYVEKYTLRTIAIFGTGLTAISSIMKIFVASPDRYYLVIISQFVCAISQNFIVNIPSKVACTWFGAEEVSTACGIGISGSQIGIALSMTIPTLVIRNSHDKNIVTEDLFTFFTYNAVACTGTFLLVVLFFRSKPPSPPSRSEALRIAKFPSGQKISYLKALRTFSKNKDYLVVLATLGTALGVWLTFGVIINQVYMNLVPGGTNADVGIMSFTATISGGCLGTWIFGNILDKTHQYKLVSVLVLLSSTLSNVAQAICMQLGSRIGTFIAVILNGFFSGSIMVVIYEFVVETTYPMPEVIGTTLLNVEVATVSTILIFVLDYIFSTLSYLAGYIILIVILSCTTIGMALASPELKRRNANLKASQNEEIEPLLGIVAPPEIIDQ